jgi:phenylalanyl-tRNA synthetase beta chain
MKVSLNWLREFVDIPLDPNDVKQALTLLGLGVESVAQSDSDWVLDLEVTTNRPDCLSHYGVARELSTWYRKPLKRLEYTLKESRTRTASEVSIEIADADLCSRYCARVVQNVRVRPSPAWLAERLEAVGLRPINNVADATNYVLMELGHPLHAFDFDHLRQRRIIVRRARPGEFLCTLDGVNRTLTSENLVIADAERPVGLAGVMGGQDSETSFQTRSVLIESAWFDPLSIRRTAKALAMHTEASHRFERGADIEMAPLALDRTAGLIAELAEGEILTGAMDVYPHPKPIRYLTLRRVEVSRVLGKEISWEDVERILRSLGFQPERRGTEGWRVNLPWSRLDVTRPVDLVEEVGRHYGYDHLPSRLRPAPPRVARDKVREKELAISSLLVSLGYRETIISSMIDPEENARFTDRPPVILANPLSQDASALRSTPVPSMVHAIGWNLDRNQTDVRLFEMGKTYTARPQGLPEERRVLTLGASGYRRLASVHDSAKERELFGLEGEPRDFFDLKGELEALLDAFDIPGLRFDSASCSYYEPGLGGQFLAADTSGGERGLVLFGRLSSERAGEYKLRQASWLAEIDLERLLSFPLRSMQFRAYSRFPAVERDFSLTVPDGVTYRQIAQAIAGSDLPDVSSVRPADLFRGGSTPSGQHSLLLRVTFQSLTHTLTSDEVSELGKRILGVLGPLNVKLRGGQNNGE